MSDTRGGLAIDETAADLDAAAMASATVHGLPSPARSDPKQPRDPWVVMGSEPSALRVAGVCGIRQEGQSNFKGSLTMICNHSSLETKGNGRKFSIVAANTTIL